MDNKTKNVLDLCKLFWDIGNKTLATGIVKIKADSQETSRMLLKAFNWKINFNSNYEQGGSIIKSWNDGGKIWFCDVGLSSYKFTIQQLFQLTKGVEGLDYSKLKDSDYSMNFEFVDVGPNNIEKIRGMKLIHQKGEPVETPKIIWGKSSSFVYNTENVINVMFDKSSYFAKTNAADRANLFLSELCSCLYMEPEEVVETLKKNKEALKKTFKVKTPIEIYYQKDDEFEEPEDLDLKAVLEEASK